MNDTKFMKNNFYLSQYTSQSSCKWSIPMQASASESSSTSKMAGWVASRSSSVGSASLNGSSSLSLIISSCYILMKISSFYTLLHGTRISPQTKTVAILQISPRVNDWGLIRTGALFQNLGLHGGLFEYGA